MWNDHQQMSGEWVIGTDWGDHYCVSIWATKIIILKSTYNLWSSLFNHLFLFAEYIRFCGNCKELLLTTVICHQGGGIWQ